MRAETAAGLKRPVSVFLSYAQEDEALKREFEDYLAILQQVRLISGWVERQIKRGMDWSQTIDPRLLIADLIIVMLSPSLLASGYCSGAEFHEAFARNETREQAILVPLSLRSVNLRGHPLEPIMGTPYKPIVSWPDRQEAWRRVDHDIRHVIVHYFKA